MTDDLDIRLKDLLAERGRPDPMTSTTLVDAIGRFPARSSRRFHPALVAAVVVMVVGVGAFLATRGEFVGGGPVPPDPAAFAGDPRMDACFAAAGSVEFAFEMRHARDYQRHLPAMGRSPELEVDDQAFALIFAPGDLRVGAGGAPGASPEPTQPGHRAVCVLVEDSPNLYTDVDITGFQAMVPDVDLSSPSAEQSPAETTAAGPTVAPAPTPMFPSRTGPFVASVAAR